ncbi:MAG: HEAT repeat domain-containing protein [Methanoregulaceae archaeon]|nr:HEAT repeat domain-containing protein [Methanoregulaceae archaeon]
MEVHAMEAEVREHSSQVPTTDEIYRLIAVAREGASPRDRIAALVLLGESRDPRAVTPVAECCTDENAEIRLHAIEALHKVRSVRSVPVLMERLKDRNEDIAIRMEAARTLADIKSFHTLEPLVDLSLDTEEDPDIRILVARMLGRNGKK